MNKYHKGSDIESIITIEGGAISSYTNVYVLVVARDGQVVKRMSLLQEVGFEFGDVSIVDDGGGVLQAITHRLETNQFRLTGNYYYQVRVGMSDLGFEDSVKKESSSSLGFVIVSDIETTSCDGGGDLTVNPASGRVEDLSTTETDTELVLKPDGSGGVVWGVDEGAGGGEVNTASNLGVEGEGVFSQKNGVDLEFKKIKAGSNITLSSDSEGITIESTGGGGGDAALTEDVEVIGVGTVGAVSDGYIFSQNTLFTDAWKELLQASYPPTPPTASLTVTPSSTQEIGATVSFTLTPSFTQNDAGSMNSLDYSRTSTIIQSQSDLTPHVDANRIISAGTLLYSVTIGFDSGPVFTPPGKDGQITAASLTTGDTVLGSYRNWFGAYGTTPPTTGSELRSLAYSYNNTFTLNTGTTALYYTVAIPSTKTLVSVIDEDALNADITSSYALSGTITTTPDGGGNNVSYKVYILNIATPYSTNHRHNVTTS